MSKKYISRVGMTFDEIWEVIATKRAGKKTNYILENFMDGRRVEICQGTMNFWLKNPDKVNVERILNLNQKRALAETGSSSFKLKNLLIQQEKDKVDFCKFHVRRVKRCQDCLRYNENCPTLFEYYRKVEEIKNGK